MVDHFLSWTLRIFPVKGLVSGDSFGLLGEEEQKLIQHWNYIEYNRFIDSPKQQIPRAKGKNLVYGPWRSSVLGISCRTWRMVETTSESPVLTVIKLQARAVMATTSDVDFLSVITGKRRDTTSDLFVPAYASPRPEWKKKCASLAKGKLHSSRECSSIF